MDPLGNGGVIELEKGWVYDAQNFISEVFYAVVEHAVETFDQGEIHRILVLEELLGDRECVFYVAPGDVCFGSDESRSLSRIDRAYGIGFRCV